MHKVVSGYYVVLKSGGITHCSQDSVDWIVTYRMRSQEQKKR